MRGRRPGVSYAALEAEERGARGIAFRAVADAAAGRIAEIAVRTPSIMNIEACTHFMLRGVLSAADITSTFISSDPCVACTER